MVMDANATMDGDDGDLRHQFVRRIMAAARALIRVSPRGPSAAWSSCTSKSAFAAATLAPAAALVSAAISRRIATGSHAARSTPRNAFAEASARDGRPPFRLGALGVAVRSSTICLALKFNHRGFLAFSGARAWRLRDSARGHSARAFPRFCLPPVFQLATLRSVAFHSFLEFVCKHCKLCHTFNLVFPLGALLVLGLDGGMPSGDKVDVVWHCFLLVAGWPAGAVIGLDA